MTISILLREPRLKRQDLVAGGFPRLAKLFISSFHVLGVGADANCAVVDYACLRRIIQQAHNRRRLGYLSKHSFQVHKK